MVAIIERVPSEILLQIFEDCKDQVYGDTKSYLFGLSRVCRFWRSVIHTSPTLWSDIWLDVSTGMVEEQATYWLERAGETLLSITILFPRRGKSDNDVRRKTDAESAKALPVRLAGIIGGVMHRWKKIALDVSPLEAQLFLDNCTGYTPNLLNLSLRDFSFHDNNDESKTLYIPFQRSGLNPPASTSFSNFLPVFSSFGVAVAQLTIGATAARTRSIHYVDMLLSCPNLVTCRLVGTTHDTPIGGLSDDVVVPLPRLINLQVSSIPDPEYLLGALRLEALQSLCVVDLEWGRAMPSALRRIFQTCGDSLTKVSIKRAEDISRSDDDPPSIPTWGRVELPSVKHFTFHADDVAYPLLQQLSLPQAQTLVLDGVPCGIAHSLMSSSLQLNSASFSDLSGEVPQHASVATFPDLSLLSLGGESLGILDYISTPHLNKLTLTDGGAYRPLAGPALCCLILRSNPPIQWLVLFGVVITDEDAIWCLRRLPHIETIQITECPISDATLRALQIPLPLERHDGSEMLLPQLKTAHITSNIYTTPQAIMAFVTSRNASPSTAIRGTVSSRGLTPHERETLLLFGVRCQA
ncbi:hypothetical protein BOTBODRAFT_224868 [Botryobasidium botryosum FD-172 SS1]|uniref:F-box domain-containing protein n=1 Tax=Botryobasidium botryosum (strain FD-172 SS1) TaxID=930990 RepID=A0A067MYW0_BOTB1|nr:hypothetical protein BOTBODRAFT_224868 [Botryobasidium botryosum FD-172 SS1]